MAEKIEIINNALVVTNTGTGIISISEPSKDYWYKESDLQIGRVTFYDANGLKGDFQITQPIINLSDAVDSELTPFTESTFRTFCTANLGKSSSSDAGADLDEHIGFADYNDASTSVTPTILVADTWTDVPNDTLGAYTNTSYLPEGMTTLMDGSTGYLDFSELTLGSDIHIRIDYTVTPNTNNALVESRYTLGNGGGIYSLPINSKRLDSGSGIPYAADKGSFYIYMGDTNTLQGVGKLQVKLTTGGTLVNNGVAIKIYKK